MATLSVEEIDANNQKAFKTFQSGAYWRKRRDLLSYHYFHFLIRCLGAEARSLVDVGSGNAPYLDWFDWIPERVSVDLHVPYQSAGVRGLKGNIHELAFPHRFDICTCLQVLKNVPDAGAFAHRLMEIGKVVLISVPYKWPKGSNKHHVHDPVDEKKVARWFGRKPDYQILVREPFVSRQSTRLFALYDVENPGRIYDGKIRKSRRDVPYPR